MREKPEVLQDDLTPNQSDLAVSFYDAACDFPAETFEQIAKRLVPKGFGRSSSSPAFKREAQRMFKLAR
jgi:hypothetical protein